ncbi:hypothetical protein SHIRM173S_13025 [Streptomyces hirsutus]
MHAAPWSVGSQGYDNVSHGCVGMSTGDAEWFFDTFHQGDLVEVVNSGGATMEPFGNGFGDWNLTWAQWREGSALVGGTGPGPAPEEKASLRPQPGLSRRTGPTVCPAGQVGGGRRHLSSWGERVRGVCELRRRRKGRRRDGGPPCSWGCPRSSEAESGGGAESSEGAGECRGRGRCACRPPCLRPGRRTGPRRSGRLLAQQGGQGGGELHRLHRQRHRGLRPAPGGQPGVLGPAMSSSTGGRWKISSLICRHKPMPPMGTASPSRTQTSIPPRSSSLRTAGRGRALDELHHRARPGRAGGRSRAAPARGCWSRRCRPAPWRSPALFLRRRWHGVVRHSARWRRMLLPSAARHTGSDTASYGRRRGDTYRTAPPGVRAG